MPNVPPRRVIESRTEYVAVGATDPSDRFRIIAETESLAKVQLIDKLGYAVKQGDSATSFALIDADPPHDVQAVLRSKTYEAALDEVLSVAQWRIRESYDMIGGELGEGFGDAEED